MVIHKFSLAFIYCIYLFCYLLSQGVIKIYHYNYSLVCISLGFVHCLLCVFSMLQHLCFPSAPLQLHLIGLMSSHLHSQPDPQQRPKEYYHADLQSLPLFSSLSFNVPPHKFQLFQSLTLQSLILQFRTAVLFLHSVSLCAVEKLFHDIAELS